MNYTIRNAVEADLEYINDIYNYYVLDSTCTYQIKPEPMEKRKIWFSEHDEKYPVIVAEENNIIIGWACLSKFHKRAAYIPTVEISVYIHHEKHARGLGSAFYNELVSRAQALGYHSVMAGISADQIASIRLHEKFQFEKVAHYKEVGFKFEQWLDVVWYQLML